MCYSIPTRALGFIYLDVCTNNLGLSECPIFRAFIVRVSAKWVVGGGEKGRRRKKGEGEQKGRGRRGEEGINS